MTDFIPTDLNDDDALSRNDHLYKKMMQIQIARQEDQGYSNFGEAVGESMVHETIVGDFARWVYGAWMDNEEGYYVTPQMLQRIAPDIPDSYPELLNAKSDYELHYRIENIRSFNEHREALSNTDGGTAAMVVGGMLDPAFLTAGVLTGGATVLGVGMKAGKGLKDISRMKRIQGATRGGLIAAAETGILESARAGFSDTWGLEDVPFAMAMGLGVGGAIGGRFPQVTVPRQLADQTTKRLYRQRFNVLAETTEMTIDEARAAAEVYARSAGKMGYGKLGNRKYHTDPSDIAEKTLVQDINLAVATGGARKTSLGELTVPNEAGSPVTAQQFQERTEELTKRATALVAATETALSENAVRVAGLRGDKLRQEAVEAGIDLTGPRGGTKSAKRLKKELTDSQGETVRETFVSQRGKLREDQDTLQARWAEADAVRDAEHNINELTGGSIDDILKKIPTYDKALENRDVLQKTVDLLDSTAWLGGTTASTLLQSSNSAVRRLGTLTVDDPLMRTGYSVMRAAESSYKQRMINWRHNFYPLERKVAKELGISMLPSSGWRGIVRTRIANAVRSEETPSGALGEATTFVRSFLNREREFGNSYGIWNLEKNDQYLPREPNRDLFRQLHMNDEEGLHRLISGAIRSGSTPGFSEPAIEVMAKRFSSAAREKNYKSGRMSSTKAWSDLKEQLKKDLVDTKLLDEAEFDDFMDAIAPIAGKKSIVRGGRARMSIDENYIDPESGIRFSDLLNNDLDDLINRSVKANRGAGYWHRMVDNLPERTPVTQPTGKTAEVVESGPAGYSVNDVIAYLKKQGPVSEGEERAIRHHYNSMLGIRQWTEMGDKAHSAVRAAADISYVTSMANAGFANAAEMMTAVSTYGFTAMESFMGQMLPTFRRAIEGQLYGAARLQNKNLDLLESLTAVGSMNYRNVLKNRMEDGMDFAGGGTSQATSEALQRGLAGGGPLSARNRSKLANAYRKAMGTMRTATHMSPTGIGPMDQFSRRAASDSALQHFINVMYFVDKKGGIGVFKEGHNHWAVSRIKALGLDDEDVTKIINVLKTPGAVVERRNYRFKKKYLVGDDALWQTSPELHKFHLAVQRDCDRVIQRSSVSTVPWVLNNPVGRLILQFRTFGVSALAQQAKHGLRAHDRAAFTQFVGLLGAGWLLAYTKALSKVIGWDEPRAREYLDSALSPEKLGAAAVQNHAMLQIGTPIYDVLGRALIPDYPEDGLFGYSHRHNGIGAAAIEAIPIVDKVSNAYDLLDFYLLDPPKDGYTGVTQQHLQKWKSILPNNNGFGIDNILNSGIQHSGYPARK